MSVPTHTELMEIINSPLGPTDSSIRTYLDWLEVTGAIGLVLVSILAVYVISYKICRFYKKGKVVDESLEVLKMLNHCKRLVDRGELSVEGYSEIERYALNGSYKTHKEFNSFVDEKLVNVSYK